MAERVLAANDQPDLVHGPEGQASSNQAGGSFTPKLAGKEQEELQVTEIEGQVPPIAPPVESKSRLGRLLFAPSIRGRRIRRGLYASLLSSLVAVWTVLAIKLTDREQQQQGANLNSDLNDRFHGTPPGRSVRDIGNDQRTLLRMT
jgi:hypothetical protein